MLVPLSLEDPAMARVRTMILFAVFAPAVLPLSAGAASPDKLKIKLETSYGQDAGTATFKESKDGTELTIHLDLKNIRFGEHAVHIHENPVCDPPDFEGAGMHFNPSGKQHGYLNPQGHHNGDLPQNISIDEDHMGEMTVKVHDLTLEPGAPDSIIGRSIVVHERADDMKSEPSGRSGNRIACGVIQY